MSTERAEQVYRMLADTLGYGIYRIGANGGAEPTDLAELMSLEHADIVARGAPID